MSETSLSYIKVWTDGSCNCSTRIGGWAIVKAFFDDAGKPAQPDEEAAGRVVDTTNNRMELTAAIQALKQTPAEVPVTIITDSEYVKNGIETWIHSWKQKGWRTSNKKKPVLNKDLWEELDQLRLDRKVTWEWTRGHADDVRNNQADLLAGLAARDSQVHSSTTLPTWESL